MNAFYYYEKKDGQTIKCRKISQTRIKKMWKLLTKKPMLEIIGIYVSDEKFEIIWNDLYFERATQSERKRIDRGIRKEWRFKGYLDMNAGFVVSLEDLDYEDRKKFFLIVIRSKDYRIREKGTKILKHELLHIIN